MGCPVSVSIPMCVFVFVIREIFLVSKDIHKVWSLEMETSVIGTKAAVLRGALGSPKFVPQSGVLWPRFSPDSIVE